MKAVLGTVTQILFYVLAAAIFIWTGSLTVSLVSRLLPGDPIKPFLALAIFDVAALGWLLLFMFRAKGLAQRGIALIMMSADLLGVILATIAELFLGGQSLASIPAGLGNVAVWAVGVATAINLIAIYAYHIASPEIMTEIRIRTMEDKLTAQSIDKAEADLNLETPELAQLLANRQRDAVKARLNLLDTPKLPETTSVDPTRPARK